MQIYFILFSDIIKAFKGRCYHLCPERLIYFPYKTFFRNEEKKFDVIIIPQVFCMEIYSQKRNWAKFSVTVVHISVYSLELSEN
jgi:hypothetical protein